jgi:hypothetical protein
VVVSHHNFDLIDKYAIDLCFYVSFDDFTCLFNQTFDHDVETNVFQRLFTSEASRFHGEGNVID